MAGQSIFFKMLAFINNNKMLLNTRLSFPMLTPSSLGVRSNSKEMLEKSQIPERPKKPLTAYFRFLLDKRPQIIKENPNIANKDILKKIGEEWKNCSTETKFKYELEARKEKDEYDQQVLEYSAQLTPEMETVLKELRTEHREKKKRRKLKKEFREMGKPKKPISSYGIFLMEHAERTGQKVNNLFKELKETWSLMPETEKEKYRNIYRKNKEQFDKDLEAWESKMLAEGKGELVRSKVLIENLPMVQKTTKP